jgi:hypothetical protein
LRICILFYKGNILLNTVWVLQVEAWEIYIALSRVTSRKRLKVVITNDEGENSNTTENVVYKKNFQNV